MNVKEEFDKLYNQYFEQIKFMGDHLKLLDPVTRSAWFNLVPSGVQKCILRYWSEQQND